MRLLGLGGDEIRAELDQMERDSKAIRRTVIELAWYMRGSASQQEIWSSSASTREMMNKLVAENIERYKKTGVPLI